MADKNKGNPYSRQFATKDGAPLPENLRFKGHQSAAIASNGEINASSKKDLMGQIGNLITSYTAGDVRRVTAETKRMVAKERREVLREAIADSSGQMWKALGEVITEDIFETTGREGFCRKLMAFKELEQGDIARVRFRTKDVVAYTAASASEITPIIVRNNWHYLPEFYLGNKILVEERDIHQSTGDILEEKYQEGLEAIMTAEDRLWKRMADEASSITNTLTYFTTFTPGIFFPNQISGNQLGYSCFLLCYCL